MVAVAADRLGGGLGFHPIGTWADGIRLWIEHQGAWGPLFLILLMGLWGQLFPTMPLQLVVAGLYGLWYGALITYAGASLAMLISLLVGRFLLRAWLADFLQRFKLTRSIDAALVAESWRVVALIRLSPMQLRRMQSIGSCRCRGYLLSPSLWCQLSLKPPA